METIYEIQRIRQVINDLEGEKRYKIHTPKDAAQIASRFIGDEDREVFFVMCLNTQNHVVAVHRAHVGSLNASIAHPRDVFKSAILNNAASVIVAHLHPSQVVDPSDEDIQVTKRLSEAGRIIGIELLDHVIVNADEGFTSLKQQGEV